jgi:glutamine synthetase
VDSKKSKRKEILDLARKNRIAVTRFQYMGNDLTERAMASSEEFLGSHLDNGIGIARGMQSFNAIDELVPEGSFGPEDSEFRIVPDLDTFAMIPYAPRTARLISELWNKDYTPSETDGRFFLRRMIDSSRRKGFLPFASFETEFYLLRWVDGKPSPFISEKLGSTHGYDLLSDYLVELTDDLGKMGVRVERLKKEYGNSQIEPTLRYSDALKAADDLITLKDVAKGIASKRDLSATFMPKPFQNIAGNGMHVHLSLIDSRTRKNVFYKKGDELSSLGRYFVGGIMEHMKGICVFDAPISNSYKRILPHTWSPSHVSWGYDNRGTALRIPSTSTPDGARVEFRVPDPSANPYLALGSLLASGLEGIEKKIEPPEPLSLDPSDVSNSELERMKVDFLPRTLGEAIDSALSDPWVRETMGSVLFDEYLAVRSSEWKAYREQVTEWEVSKYLESI